ncbi:hypothetical protein M409DRAFT_56691 [Zasmidium cellare ATCC 36951]|uniref:F-box domain-containing protein n=1 Tax=Zasmidium cellare ATCC 36951 TaxID=1080233 RepID=A0A6A6CB52_ZASCE|nr:uncharacterized protein M409DRAFT_56691 [Zasmidium cellare ATCC 36951]KAF2164427.1 hypothetical protein M409DRAFT_56691 [Zasmidium cellare ATCC 36951]
MEASPLMRLPPEIRNNIYELALYEPAGMRPVLSHPRAPSQVESNPLALALCCRQLYQECIRLFYNINHFWIQSMTADFVTRLESFSEAIGEQNTAALREVRFIQGLAVASVMSASRAETTTAAPPMGFPSSSTTQVPSPAPPAAASPQVPRSPRFLKEHLMTMYLNIRNNTTIHKLCERGTKAYITILFWIDSKIFTEEAPYVIYLNCADLKTSLRVQMTQTRLECREVRTRKVDPAEIARVIAFLENLLLCLAHLEKLA